MFSFNKPYITIKIVILILLLWGWILDRPEVNRILRHAVNWMPLATLIVAVVISIAALRWVDKRSRR